ncbi:hypothetical protein CJ179_50275 [Rhodococcus sp. ACS1]|uniref:hypothetical protein n=1 Tax=Rhodococcus sp. ACS1 TaxID=2028570 RepID=UPI000BB143DA|nr:hypothetical protein [Rhodococcus sp. ACS1]PBC35027.1 hypothetical protein CJ179_50275 [Rhodococcus sp. ACS1]
MRNEATPAGTGGGDTSKTTNDTEPNASTSRITHVCNECGRAVDDGDGYVHIRYPKPGDTRRLHWEIHHRRCDPNLDRYDYAIAVERVRTLVQLAHWTQHLGRKLWFPATDWPDLVVRALRSVPWTTGGLA